jgi:hypothetical protein
MRPSAPVRYVRWVATPSGIPAAINLWTASSPFQTGILSDMATLQQLYSRDYTVRRMLSRKWRLVVFAMGFSILPHHCAAGPIKKPKFVICLPRELSFVPIPFPRRVTFPPSPTTVFHLGGVDLTHIIAPSEFRKPNPKAARPTGDILQTPRWPPDEPAPCRPFPGWYGAF